MNSQEVVRIVKSGWKNFKRNSYLSFSAVGIMAVALIMLVSLLAINITSDRVVSSLEEKVDVTAFFELNTNEEQILAFKSEIETFPEVKNVQYISRNKALELFQERHIDDSLIQESLSELEENPLQASLNIKASDTNQYASIVSSIESSRFSNIIDKVNFYENQAVISKIDSISGGLQFGGLIVTMAIALIAVMVTFNTIRLTIYSQRKEIEIKKLVGASNWQVRGPYLVEGGVYGLLAAIITVAIVYPSLYGVSDKVSAFISYDLFSYFSKFSFQIVPLIIIVGVALGVLSSTIAIRKHLKV